MVVETFAIDIRIRAFSLAKLCWLNWLIDIYKKSYFLEIIWRRSSGAYELADIAHLVIIPAHGLHQLMVACRDHAGLGSIEEGAIGHADDIAAYDLVFCIAVAFIDGRLHAGVNFFNGDFLPRTVTSSVREPVGWERAVLRRPAYLSAPVIPVRSPWPRQCCWDDIGRCGPCPAEVALGMGASWVFWSLV